MQVSARYNYYRDYDPDTGRYLQPDPIGLAGGLNTYMYGYDNPLRYIDPTGEFGFVGGAIALGVDVTGQLIKYKGRWRCVDLVEAAAAAGTGAVLPGFGTVLKDFLLTFAINSEVLAGAVAGSAVRAAYMIPPELDGPTGRLSIRLGDLMGDLPCECSDSCGCGSSK